MSAERLKRWKRVKHFIRLEVTVEKKLVNVCPGVTVAIVRCKCFESNTSEKFPI